MNDLFQTLLILHIAGGSIGLMSGTVAAIVKKGRRIHNAMGKVFFFSMLITAVAALIMSNLPNHINVFLFAVGGFTFYMIASGYRIVFLKRQAKQQAVVFTMIDYSVFAFGLLFSVFMLYLAVKFVTSGGASFAVVPAVFGLICLNFIRADLKILRGVKPVKTIWMTTHIGRMMGALIAAYTAFLVVNVQTKQGWILWLLPSLIGSIFIVKFIRKYAPKKKPIPTT